LRWNLSALANSLYLKYRKSGRPTTISDCIKPSERRWKTLCRMQRKMTKVLRRLAVEEGLAGR